MSKNKSFAKSIFGFSISSWVNIILGMVYTVLSTRLLLPEVYGTVSMFINSSNTLMYLISLGFDASLIRFFNEPPNGESQRSFSSKIIGIVSLQTFIFFIFSYYFFFESFSNFMFERVNWLLTVLLFVAAYCLLLLRFFNIIYRMSFDIKRYTIQNILMQSSAKMITLLAALYNPTYETIIIFQVIGIIIITIIYTTLQHRQVFELKQLLPKKNMLTGYSPVVKFAIFSVPLYLSTNLNIILSQWVILKTLGADMMGVYSSVAIFGSLLTGLSTGFSTFWSAYVFKNYKNDHNKICLMSNYILLGVIILMAVFVLFKDMFYLFIGEQYYMGIYFFSIILVIYALDLLSQATFYGIAIVNKNYITAITNCIFVAINTALAYYGAMNWGIIGATYCMLFSKLILFVINSIIAQRYYTTIENPIKFGTGLLLIIIIGILPSQHFETTMITLIVIFILLVSKIMFKEQYNNGYILLKKIINNNG